MRRLLATLAIALSLLPFAAHAQAPTDLWKIEKFSVELNVGKDGILDVTETVTANFLEPRHGIYRYVPEKGTFTDGTTYNLGLRLSGVTMDGAVAEVSESHENGNVVWRIGNANVTMTGQHVYVIQYSARNAIGRFSDHDELYWNISGDGWDVPMPNVSAKLLLPDGVKTDRPSICYTGAYGSKESDCTVVDGGSLVGFVTKHADEPMTIVAGFPKGSIGTPPFDIAGFILLWGWWLVPVMAFLMMWRKWEKDGKEKDLGPVVAQYEPTDGLSPAELMTLLAQKPANSLSAGIVNLAVKGYIEIEELKASSALASLLTGKNYRLTLKKGITEPMADLKPHEKALIQAIFATGTTMLTSSMKDSFYKHIPALNKAVMDDVVAADYFVSDPAKATSKWQLYGVAMVVLMLFVAVKIAFIAALPLLVTGLIIFIFGSYMARWSDKGAAAAWQARGFKEFVTKVEKYRGPWMAEQNIFEKILPYAMVFGVATKWAKAFEGLAVPPPQWYRGADGMATGFVASTFVHDLNKFSSDFNHNAVSTPNNRSSGSGFGGGGFSGGGGGGGGGGSW